MKAHLNKEGFLTIESESGIESYALEKWCEDNIKPEKESHKGLLIMAQHK
ncbi:hypothetical protein [Christiangramia crocea]|uniref:Uncharacterized protein n=1 Tax=Christiangramia crocea TaxID=2904124 RepID=A0A9X1UX90_9FLAO|nr:hypothetical protein [Gramella crocea]MCG9971008.1 hypothetical protein [Gramella crocea]